MPWRQRNALKFFLQIVCSTDHSWQHPVQDWVKRVPQSQLNFFFIIDIRIHTFLPLLLDVSSSVLPTQRARSPTVAAARARGSKGLRVFNIQIKERNPAFVPEIIAIYGCVSVKGESFLAGARACKRACQSAPSAQTGTPVRYFRLVGKRLLLTPSSGLTSNHRKPETVTLLVVELWIVSSHKLIRWTWPIYWFLLVEISPSNINLFH